MRNIRLATRQLTRNPSFSAIIVLTFALGVGASTLIFSVINGVLLEPLPYAESDRIVRLFQVSPNGSNRTTPSDPNFTDLKEQTRSFAALAQYGSSTDSISGGAEPVRGTVGYAARELFEVLRVQPAAGRLFVADELRENAPRAVLISHSYWQRYLGGTQDFASRTLKIGANAFSIIGVMPQGFDFPDHAQVWLPRETFPMNPSRTSHNTLAIGRLADGVSLAQAREDASVVARRLRAEYGDDTWMVDAAVVPLREVIVGNTREALYVLGAAVLLLFLVACTNIVSMLLARAVAREQELTVRVALGAERWRLVGQFLTEALLVCGAGGVLGVLFAWWGLAVLGATYGASLPRIDSVRIDWLAVVFAAGLTLAAAVVLSLLLARHATRVDATRNVNQRGVAGRRGSLGREGLVAAQIAMALVLLVGAVLLGRSFQELVTVDPGFRTDDVLLMNVALPRPPEGADAAPLARFEEELMERLRGLPGVQTVGGVTFAPLAGRPTSNGTIVALNRPDEITTIEDFVALSKDPTRTTFADFRVASEDYFAALDIPLLQGRVFERRDGPSAEHAAVVSRQLAEEKWPGENPLGKLLQFGNMDGDFTPYRVVGVVGDVREYGLDTPPRPTFYGYYLQRPRSIAWSFWIAMRAPNAAALVPAARAVVRDMNPDVPPEFRTSEEMRATSLAPQRFNLVMVGVFGASALLLALAGIYGALAFSVAQRTREIGVRIALGAQGRSVIGMILRKCVLIAGAGIVAGLLVSLGASRLVASLLYGTSPNDPLAYAAAAGALLLAAVAAAWLPAMRAARVDPIVALRHE